MIILRHAVRPVQVDSVFNGPDNPLFSQIRIIFFLCLTSPTDPKSRLSRKIIIHLQKNEKTFPKDFQAWQHPINDSCQNFLHVDSNYLDHNRTIYKVRDRPTFKGISDQEGRYSNPYSNPSNPMVDYCSHGFKCQSEVTDDSVIH